MEPMPAVYTANLFSPLHEELIALLQGLAPDQWEGRTVAGTWRVRDVAAHLLDVDLRKLSAYRDGHLLTAAEPIDSHHDLVRFLNALNAEWVGAARRLSSRLLVELLSFTGPRVADLVASLPPHEPSLFAVGWAGEGRSQNWLDTGREFTEHWQLFRGHAPAPAVTVTLAPDTAWRLLYNALPGSAARARVRVEGDTSLAEPLIAARSIMV